MNGSGTSNRVTELEKRVVDLEQTVERLERSFNNAIRTMSKGKEVSQ